MRLQLSGGSLDLAPVVLTLTDGIPFQKQQYVDQGYTNFEVVAIGAAGGQGGGIQLHIVNGPYYIYTGAGGGGGGLHRVTGLLSSIPSSAPVVVGVPGTNQLVDRVDWDGNVNAKPVYTRPDGTDGSASSFNGTLCQASGGKGGVGHRGRQDDHGQYNGPGGAGGIGGRSAAGGGGAGQPVDNTDSTWSGGTGSWDGTVGGGGGGRAFNLIQLDANGVWNSSLTADGNKAPAEPNYSSLVSAAGSAGSSFAGSVGKSTTFYQASVYPATAPYSNTPSGGGAKATPLTGSTQEYGTYANGGDGKGAVFIKLTRPAV